MELKTPTTQAWLSAVMANFDTFLQDHASCEKKASGMALSISAHYPDKPEIVSAMADLAVEELSHYREVIRLLSDRKIAPSADVKDPYVNALNKCIRRAPETFLLDRLLVAAIVERRGHERFCMIMHALEPGIEKRFYQALVASEKRHYQLFLKLAQTYFEADLIEPRLNELLTQEAEIVLQLPPRAALH